MVFIFETETLSIRYGYMGISVPSEQTHMTFIVENYIFAGIIIANFVRAWLIQTSHIGFEARSSAPRKRLYLT